MQVDDDLDLTLDGMPSASANPYPGLRPFLPHEEHLFFGRDLQVDGMIAKLERTRFLAVVGTSGSGKSSLVNCGLRPALSRGRMASAGPAWCFAPFRPGNRPIRALAQALADALKLPAPDVGRFSAADFVENTLRSSPLGLIDVCAEAGLPQGTQLLVIVDQFEELFRYQQTEASDDDAGVDAKAFVNLIVEAAAQRDSVVHVVITMRSDFLGDCAQFFGLPEAINAGQFLVPRLTRDERRRAITGPAALGGVAIDPVLLTRLVNDVGDNPDQLSILQHALSRTWARWQEAHTPDAPIGPVHYEGIGTMARALDAHAEEAFADLDADGRTLCEHVFKALTDRTQDARGTRRPTRLGELCAIAEAQPDAVAAVLEVFRRGGRAFLMPPAGEPLDADTVIDISHESLMRVWERLVKWVREESESAQIYRRLADSARRRKKDNSVELLWDRELQNTLSWLEREQPNPAWGHRYDPDYELAMAYLDESRRQRDDYQALQKRRKTRRLLIYASLAVATALALAMLLYIANQDRKKKSVELALQQARASRVAAEGQAAHAAGEIDRALLLGVAAQQVHPVEEGQDLLLRLLRTSARKVLYEPSGDTIASVVFTADARRLATVSPKGRVSLWDSATGQRIGEFQGPVSGDEALAFTQDGKYLVVAGSALEGSLVWDVAAGVRHTLPTRAPAQSAPSATTQALHAESALVAASDFEQSRVVVWDIARSRMVGATKTLDRLPRALRFSPDGKLLASGDEAGRLVLLDPASSSLDTLRVLSASGDAAYVNIAFNAAGTRLAAVRADRRLDLWELPSGRRLESLNGLGNDDDVVVSSYVAFSPDGRFVAWSGGAGRIVTTNLENGQRDVVRRGRGGNLNRFAFRPDGKVLAAGDQDGTVLLWDVVARAQLGAELRGHGSEPRAIGFSADGQTLATADQRTSRVVLWDVSPDLPRLGRIFDGVQPMRGVAFSPDGKWLAAAGEDATVVRQWVVGSKPPVELRAEGLGPILSVAVGGADGRWLAVGAHDRVVAIWDLRAGESTPPRVLIPEGRDGAHVTGVAFSRQDVPTLATCRLDGRVQVHDLVAGTTRVLQSEGAAMHAVAISADGRWVASGRKDGSVLLWDLTAAASPNAPALTLKGHDGAVLALAFDDSGRRLATAGIDGIASVWDLATREPLSRFEDSVGSLHSVAFAPGGRTVAVGDSSGAINFWNPETGLRSAPPLRSHREPVQALSFGPEGRLLASAGRDRGVGVWDADAAHWEERACRIVNRRPVKEDWPPNLADQLINLQVCGGTDIRDADRPKATPP